MFTLFWKVKKLQSAKIYYPEMSITTITFELNIIFKAAIDPANKVL